jgi:cob(I)alamin adenosyltransferase
MWYSGKGDSGTTKTLRQKSGARVSKSSCQTEALGALDELNSFLGILKARALSFPLDVKGENLAARLHSIQENLFIAQAEVAGAKDKKIILAKTKEVEELIGALEKKVPAIKSFCIPGGAPSGRTGAARELAANLDYARALARRVERRVLAAVEKKETKTSAETLAYLNRLSSFLYALVRYLHHNAGVPESAPSYK